jgi:hypothetical protein
MKRHYSEPHFNKMLIFLFCREANRRAHSKPGTVPFVPEKKKHILEEQE